ncbi:methyl-accepting chemotaxis protein [Paraburkholderia fungorum]|uniref:methyl-accepting chemotaxis protein n=1 Tax=Paraburkholderia fungorum TaxID=134537 RepID=UPI0038B8B4F0
MISIRTADAAASGSLAASATPRTKARRSQSISLQTRIALTMTLLAALMLVIGALGLSGAYRANRANRDTYENKLAATIHIGEAELSIARTRLVLGGVTAQGGAARAQEQIKRASEYFRQSDAAWRRFVDGVHEPNEAPLIDAATQRRNALRDAMNAFIDALKDNDQDKATKIGIVQLSPLFNDMNVANDQLKRALYENAKRSYLAAENYFNLFVAGSSALIALGILAAVFSWASLRRAIMKPLADTLAHFEAMASGDLRRDIATSRGDEMGLLLRGLRAMQTQLSHTVMTVRRSCESIGKATREIAAGTLDLSSRTEEQAASLEETAASMTELTATVRQNVDQAQQARMLADEASLAAKHGSATIDQMNSTMLRIDGSSRRIADITQVIEGIAFQTNILALNAAVEAARAGQHGRGFAVVAAEVRALAQHASTASKEIGGLISDSVGAIVDGTALAADATHAMNNVLTAAQRFSTMMTGIVDAAEQQRSGIEQLDAAIGLMDSITQQNAALVEQASAAAQTLDQQSLELGRQVAVFRVMGSD